MPFIIVLGAVLALFAVTLFITHRIMRANFGRGEYKTYPTPEYYYDHYKANYPRRNVSFYSGNNRLQFYICSACFFATKADLRQ